MSRRDEMLAVIRERDAEAARAIVLSWHWWRPFLAWNYRKEARRLLALNQRDLERLPPARYKQQPITTPAPVIPVTGANEEG